ncbi:MAG: hypothetical protein AAGI14_12655 [Pseudomonadota bacterium]
MLGFVNRISGQGLMRCVMLGSMTDRERDASVGCAPIGESAEKHTGRAAF